MEQPDGHKECEEVKRRDEYSCKSKTGEDGKKRYTVKIHIDKSPGGKHTVRAQEKTCSSFPTPISDKCPPSPRKTCNKPTNKSNGRKRENSCQTDICQVAPQSCGTKEPLSCQKKAHCQSQTIHKEYSHCGQQTTICGGGERCTKDCQTDLEMSCDAAGVCHKQTSKKPYCESKHSFPFAGRTPSGHLKIHPNMVSYENREFGILVANTGSVRTTVKRLISCDEVQENAQNCCDVRGQMAKPAAPIRFYSIHSPRKHSVNDDFLMLDHPTPSPRKGPPTPKRNSFPTEYPAFPAHRERVHHQIFDCFQDNLQHSSKTMNSKKTNKRASIGENEVGHTKSWTYVNPSYDQEEQNYNHQFHHPRRKANQDRRSLDHHPPDQHYNHNGEWSSVKRHEHKNAQHSLAHSQEPEHDFLDYESRRSQEKEARQADRLDYADWHPEIEQTLGKNPFLKDHVDTVKRTWKLGNEMKETYDYFNSEGAQLYESVKKEGHAEKKHLNSNKNSPYSPYPPPAFPRNKTEMSDVEGYYTPTEPFESDNEGTLRSYYDDTSLPASSCDRDEHRPRKCNHVRDKPEANNDNPDVFGKLHYVVKGTVDGNQKVRIGDTVLPVHSVVLEIHPKLPITSMDEPPQKVKLPEFTAAPKEETCPQNFCKTCEDVGTAKHKKHHKRKNSEGADGTLPMKFDDYNMDMKVSPPGFSLPLRPPLPAMAVVNLFDGKANTNILMEDDHTPEPMPKSSQKNSMSKTEGEGGLHPIIPKETIFNIVLNPSEQDTTTEDPTKARKSRASKEKLASVYNPKILPGASGVLPNLDTQSGSILVLGGINPMLPCGPENTGREVYMYTLDVDTWTHVGILPHSRTHCGSARVGNFVYLIGGNNPEKKDENGRSKAVRTNLRLNLRSGEWDQQAELNEVRSHFGCATIGQHIFVIGGNIQFKTVSSCLVFNTEDQTWKSIASLDSTRSNMGIAVHGESILIAGGTTKEASRPVLDSVLKYDPSLNSWTSLKSLPSPRAFCSLSVVNGKFYMIAGAGVKIAGKRRNSSLPDVLVFNELANEWESAGALSNSRHGHSCAVIDDSIIIIGGVSSTTMGPLNSVEIYSTSTGECKDAKDIKGVYKSGMSAVALSNTLYN